MQATLGTTFGPDLIAELNRFRGDLPGASACAAPSINMHFSQMGVVSACCFNRTHVLGVYPKNSIEEIWKGKAIREMREAMDRYDLSRGCEKCVQTIKARDFGGTHAVYYSVYGRLSEKERIHWGMPAEGNAELAPLPMRLEFNIHNSCNLQCVMCHGLASSSIRSHREGLPPIENPYDERFVDQLEPYIPYVVEADFMGGEPFMVPIYTTLWQRIADLNPRMKVCILTNGTILDDKLRNMLERINCLMHVSIDSVFKKTYEYIRRGASFDQVMENCDYYNQLMKKRGYQFSYRYCPMRLNWREIPDTVEHCNERDIVLNFNQLDSPVNLSLTTLPTRELETVVAFLKDYVPTATNRTQELTRTNYFEMVERLAGFIDPANRLESVQMRLDTASAVVGQYSKGKERRSRRMSVEDESDALHQAAKAYLIARLNLDQALGQELDVPKAVHKNVAKALATLKGMLARTEARTFVNVYLNELVRTYSGVWGTPEGTHDETVFEKIGLVSIAAAKHRESEKVIGLLVESPLSGIYQALVSLPAKDVLKRVETSDWADLVQDRSALDVIDGSLSAKGSGRSGGVLPHSAWIVRYSEKGNTESVYPYSLSYGHGESKPLPIKMEFSLAPSLQGPETMLNQLRSQSVLLSLDSVRVIGLGARVARAAAGGGTEIIMLFDRAFVDGSAVGRPFQFEFENGKPPADLVHDPLKTLCWGLSMGGRHYRLGSHGEYFLLKDGEDAQMEAMSRIIDAPIWLPEDAVGLGGEWTREWTGSFQHREHDGRMHYRQIATLEKIDEQTKLAVIASRTTGSMGSTQQNGDHRMTFDAADSIELDANLGLVRSLESRGTVRSVLPSAGFTLEWQLKSRFGLL